MSSTEAYLKSISKYKPLTRQEEHALACQLRQGDDSASRKLWLHNLLFTVTVANKTHVPLEDGDKYQLAALGLRKAIQKFNPEEGVRLITYAYNHIRGEILDGVPKHFKNLIPFDSTSHTSSKIKFDSDADDCDFITTPEDNLSENFDDLTIEQIVRIVTADLEDRDTAILKMYFGIECHEAKSVNELALQFDISRESVFRIVRNCKRLIRRNFRNHADSIRAALSSPKFNIA